MRFATRSIMAMTYWAMGSAVVPEEFVRIVPRSSRTLNAGWSTPALKVWNQRRLASPKSCGRAARPLSDVQKSSEK